MFDRSSRIDQSETKSLGNENEYIPRHSLVTWLATGMGVGLVAPAPGTVGALVWGMPLAWGISMLPGWWLQFVAVLAINAIGVPICTRAGRELGGVKDHQSIVWDEIATVPIVFLIVPLSGEGAAWTTALIGFLLIRCFDILKPPPIRQLEKLPDGLGVMADDWAAGGIAMLALALVSLVFQR